MIFTAIFYLLVNIFSSIFRVVMPLLPSSVDNILSTVLDYIAQGANFVFIFVSRRLVLELFQWWITLAAILLTFELAIHVWKLITGNIGGEDADTNKTK